MRFLTIFITVIACCNALPAWYKCDPATCVAPKCKCASNEPPIPRDQTPQFILLTNDDAVNALSSKLVRAVADKHTNPNGCNVPVTWYTLQQGTECAVAKKLYLENHEIALHTVHHTPLSVNFNGNLQQEMFGVRDWLNQSCGIPLTDLVGYRTPYLVHNPAVRKAELANGMLYDASMIEVFQNDSDVENAPGMRIWPFTMDSGIPINCNWNYPDGQCNGSTESYPGLWEVPLWELQGRNGEHLYTMDPEGDILTLLQDNFNMNYNGNRAPFGIFLHATWYTPATTDILNKFFDWAMAQPDVWAITTKDLIGWMQAPVPKTQMNEWFKCNPVNLTENDGDVKCQLYTVQPGNSSYTISTDFAVLTSDLLAANPSLGDGSRLTVGQQIRIPPWDDTCVGDAIIPVLGPGQAASTHGMEMGQGPSLAPNTVASSPQGTAAASPSCQVHTVTTGDTLSKVAAQYGVSLDDTLAVNPGMTMTSGLQLNQTINIPPFPASCTGGTDAVATITPVTPVISSFDLHNPSSGVNITMHLTGRPIVAFQTDLQMPFITTTARALGVDPVALKITSISPVNALAGGRRKLNQAAGGDANLPEVILNMRVASVDPVGLYANATTVLALTGQYNTETLPQYQLKMTQPAELIPFENYQAMKIGPDGKPVVSSPSSEQQGGTVASTSTGGGGLSSGAIAAIVIGSVAGTTLIAALVYMYWTKKRQSTKAKNTVMEYVDDKDADGLKAMINGESEDGFVSKA